MIDHVLGRPSVQFRKIQVFAVVLFWSLYLYKGNRHGPPLLHRISSFLSPRITTWQTVLVTLLYLYVARNFGKVVGLESPEPLANLYTRSYFRATWITTALDAGFWSAMRVRRKWLRDLASVTCTLYYLVCAEQADEKVRKVRAVITVDHLRNSWDKTGTPFLKFFTRLMRPRLMRYPPRQIRIPRPQESSYEEAVMAWLYFDGPLSALKKHTKIVLDIPGGGFVAMDPRKHDDKLMAWAGKTGLPVLSLDYRKAPEYPYPYALNECYDVYHTLVSTRGRCMGLSGEVQPQIVISGDSAGGNLAVGVVLMILQSGSTDSRRWQGEESLPVPDGLVLVYPALDMNIGNWMTDEQMALIRDKRTRKTNQGVLSRKSDDYYRLTPSTPHHSDNEVEEEDPNPSPPKHVISSTKLRRPLQGVDSAEFAVETSAAHTVATTIPSNHYSSTAPAPLYKTRLAMSSMISYFNDRILTPEMLRAMIILYIGPHARPNFATDFLLSPLLAPDDLLQRFPKTHILTGERDPLVDDTVIFAGRIRQAKQNKFVSRQELGLEKSRVEFDGRDHVEIELIPGISHGFLQFVSVFPEGWEYIYQCGRWIEELFEHANAPPTPATPWSPAAERSDYFNRAGTPVAAGGPRQRHHRRMPTDSSADEEKPLEMTRIGAVAAAPKPPRRRLNRAHAANGHAPGPSRNKSLVSLASEDDLLGRRMKGLASILGGSGGGARVVIPDTP